MKLCLFKYKDEVLFVIAIIASYAGLSLIAVGTATPISLLEVGIGLLLLFGGAICLVFFSGD